MSVSEETREFLAEVTWYVCNYKPIKLRVERIEKYLAQVEAERKLNQQKKD